MIALQGPFENGLPVKAQLALQIEMGQFAGVGPLAHLTFGQAQKIGDFLGVKFHKIYLASFSCWLMDSNNRAVRREKSRERRQPGM